MNVTPDFAKRIISQVAGEDVLPLVEKLKKQDNLSEFILAQQVEYEINVVRNMLYRLYHANLVSFTRKKDKQKGWYIYYWTFNPKQIKYLALVLRKRRLERLQDRLEREKAHDYFSCANACMRLDFEKAMDFEYKCPECGELMHQEDNRENIQRLEDSISRLQVEEKRRSIKQRKAAVTLKKKKSKHAIATKKRARKR